MPPRSALRTVLPAEVREELNRRLVEGGFAGYDALTAWLAEQGYTYGRSTVAAYGQAYQQEWQESMATADAFASVVKAHRAAGGGDAGGAVLGSIVDQLGVALARLALRVQKLIDAAPDDANDEEGGPDLAKVTKLLTQIGRTVADLTQAMVRQRNWETAVQERTRAEAAADAAAAARQVGASEETILAIRRGVLKMESA